MAAPDYSLLTPPQTITPEQARNLAELVVTYTNAAPMTGSQHNLDGLANYIQRNGLQAGVDLLMRTPGVNFEVNLSTPVTPRETAIALVDRLYKDADIRLENANHYQDWVGYATRYSPEETVANWNKQRSSSENPNVRTSLSKITPEELEGFNKQAEEAKQRLVQSDLNNFIKSANKIYEGFDLTPNYGADADAQKIIGDRLKQYNYNASPTDVERWNTKAQRYGLGQAIADLDRDLALRGFDLNLPSGTQDNEYKNILLPGQLPSTYIGSPLYQERNYSQTPAVDPVFGISKPATPESVLTPTGPVSGTTNIPIQGAVVPTLPQTSAATNIPIQNAVVPQLPTDRFIQQNLGTPQPEQPAPVSQPQPQPQPQPPRPSIFSNLPVPQPLVGTFGGQPLLQPQQPQPQQPQPQITNEEFIQQQQPPVQMANGGSVGSSSSGVRRLKMSGYQEGGEVTDDEYIQEMMTGTRPEDGEVSRGLLPRELREAIDVPLDLANLAIRGTAASVAGPAYGLYKGLTSEDFGTKKGVKEARSEAERMMGEITGEPKTQAARDIMQSLGETMEEAKIPPMPQFLTTPAPGPGAAAALMRSYELAETPPLGTVKLAGDKGVKPSTPPTDQMGFYSPAEKAVMGLPQDKGTASQMLAQITKTQGVKPVELRATGLEDYLKGKGNEPVTKQEIQDFLTNNRVEVDEVVLGKGQILSPEAKRLMGDAEKRMMEADQVMAPFFEKQEAGSLLQGQEPYSTFYRIRGPLSRKIAGGDQEALAELDALNLPPDIRQAVLDFGAAKTEYVKYSSQARKMEKPKFDKYNIPGGQNAREIYLTLPGEQMPSSLPPSVNAQGVLVKPMYATQPKFTAPSPHSVSPEADANRLAHIFLDERKDAKGNNVLFVQELQSDWAQIGKKKGFQTKTTPYDDPEYKAARARATDLLNEFNRNNANPVRQQEIRPLLDEARRVEQSFEDNRQRLPSAPFVTNTEDWVNLALKRVIKEAVDNDIDTVAFIKGGQAADKYSLRTFVDYIAADRKTTSEDDLYVSINPKDSLTPHNFYVGPDGVIKEPISADVRSKFLGEPLSKVIGKEVAEKLLSTKIGESQILRDEGLTLGGKGMEGFYDNILPKTAEKLLKKLGGGKVEQVDIGSSSEKSFGVSFDTASKKWEANLDNKPIGFFASKEEAQAAAQAAYDKEKTSYLGFKITPEMKEMVKTEGLPKFAAGGEVTDFIKRAA